MSQNTVIYLAVDKDGTEGVFGDIPFKASSWWSAGYSNNSVTLPTGTIQKLTGKPLTWDDGYREYVGENYDPTNE